MKTKSLKTIDAAKLEHMRDIIAAAKAVDAICYEHGKWAGYEWLESRGLLSKACLLHRAIHRSPF